MADASGVNKIVAALKEANQAPEASADSQDPSMFEEGAKLAAPYVAPVADYVAPVMKNKYVSGVIKALNYPQEQITKAADRLTGGTGNAESFSTIGERLNTMLPESMQNRGLAKDIGYAADVAFPAPKFDRLANLAQAAKDATIAAEITRPAAEIARSIVGPAGKDIVTRGAGAIPKTRTVLADTRIAAKDLGPGVTGVLKETKMPELPMTTGTSVPVNYNGPKMVTGRGEFARPAINPPNMGKVSAGQVISNAKELQKLKGADILSDLASGRKGLGILPDTMTEAEKQATINKILQLRARK